MTPDQLIRRGTEMPPIITTTIHEEAKPVPTQDEWSFLDVVSQQAQPLSPDAAVVIQIRLAQKQIEADILKKIRDGKVVGQVYSAGMVCCGGHGGFSTAMEVAHLPHAETHCRRCGKTTCHEFGKCKECKSRGII